MACPNKTGVRSVKITETIDNTVRVIIKNL